MEFWNYSIEDFFEDFSAKASQKVVQKTRPSVSVLPVTPGVASLGIAARDGCPANTSDAPCANFPEFIHGH